MEISPTSQEFELFYNQKKSTAIWTKIIADTLTPVSALLKIAKNLPYSYLLESVINGVDRSRYSFIGLKPDLIWRCAGNKAEINRHALDKNSVFTPLDIHPLESLKQLTKECQIELDHTELPQPSILTGYLSWESSKLLEPTLPMANEDEIGMPDGIFIRPTVGLIFDNISECIYIYSPIWYKADISAKDAYAQAQKSISDILAQLTHNLAQSKPISDMAQSKLIEPQSNMTKTEFMDMVDKAKEYIKAGDAFQIVPSQRFKARYEDSALSLYRSVRRINPSPYMFYLDFDDFQIVGASPETMVRAQEGKVTIRPLAGTRPRGKDMAEDEKFKEELLADPKELAEHLMLLDLGRNDVGRVSKVGSVKPTEEFVVERYSHVMHIVSNVEGTLDTSKYDPVDALFAGLPAGTVSGAPKIRAMEIIDELEPVARKFYAGTIGYFNGNGDMDSAIALRTALIKDKTLYVQSGVGVVYDSNPEMEYQESINKAMGLFRAASESWKYEGK
ncbi:MAG: anthranilate synthase component I [Alphaproteobacteria bacterium]